jgi:hypothetical protein
MGRAPAAPPPPPSPWRIATVECRTHCAMRSAYVVARNGKSARRAAAAAVVSVWLFCFCLWFVALLCILLFCFGLFV